MRIKLKNDNNDGTFASLDFPASGTSFSFNKQMVMSISPGTNYTDLGYYVKAWLIPTDDTDITVWCVNAPPSLSPICLSNLSYFLRPACNYLLSYVRNVLEYPFVS